MKTKKGLQKLTDTETKINKILSLEQITPKDLEPLSKTESAKLFEILTEKLNKLNGAERDLFFNKIEPITSDMTRSQVWEYNHNQINWAISCLMQDYGRMPTKTEIAEKTGLSRQTVHKHLKEYMNHPQYIEQLEQFRFMTSKVLAKVFQFAVNGDMAAAKLYFNVVDFTNKTQKQSTLIQNQNNYIQINETVLSQEALNHLNAEQMNKIEVILREALGKS